MAQESQQGGPKNESNINGEDRPLYSIFEELLPKERKKTVWKKYGLNNISPSFGILSRKINISSSNKIEGQTVNRKNESISSNESKDIREINHSRPSSDHEVYGVENDELSLEKMLFKRGSDDQFKAIGIAGMSGVGKTTLCQKIFNREDVKRQFVPRIWVCMSKQRNDDEDLKVETVKRMLEHLGVEENTISSLNKDHGLDGLLYILHQQLIGKRYLIVLDDFRDIKGWCENLNSYSGHGKKWGEHLSNGLPKGYGGTVIITSSNEEFTKEIVGEENFHQLQPLSETESCWSIYKDSAEAEGLKFNSQTSKELREELKKLENGLPLADKGEQINAKRTELKAKLTEQMYAEEELRTKCGGLPLAAKLMGKIKAELTPKQGAEARECSR